MIAIDRSQVPLLIAQYLPVEICVYHQVVPLSTDADRMTLGMVDPEDLDAVDYVGKMLAYSQLRILPQPISFQQHQELVAYALSHPPNPAELAALKAAVAERPAKPKTPALPEPPVAPPKPAKLSLTAEVPLPTSTAPPAETVQQLLNAILRRVLEEKAEQLFIEPSDDNTCRIRYRQSGILRDLFKDLADAIRAELMVSLKQLVNLDAGVVGQPMSGEVERTYRGEPLLFQLRIVPQKSKEGAILSILRGDSLLKYQQNQNVLRIAEVASIAQQAQQTLHQLQASFVAALDKLKQYPSKPTDDWVVLTATLDALKAQMQMLEISRRDWHSFQDPES